MGASPRKDYVGPTSVLRLLLNGVTAGEKATGTITLVSAIAGDEVEVNGLTYTGVAGVKSDDTEFSIDTSDTAAALDLADSIDGDVRVGLVDDVAATSALGVVTVEAVTLGTLSNAITMSTADTTITLSGNTLSGGLNTSTVTVNGNIYTGVTGAKADDTEFSVDTSDAAAATDLADSIDDDVRVGTVASAVLTATATDETITVSCTEVVSAESLNATILLSGSYSTLLSLTSNVADNNETFKRVNFMNTPFSVQSSGVDKEIWKGTTERLLAVTTEAIFNTITVRSRVLWGNREGYVSAHTASTSLTFTWLDKTKTEIDTVKTMAEVIASGSMFFLPENY